MDPITMVVGILVSGLTAGVESVVEDAVLNGYQALRERLATRYGPAVRASIDRLEQAPYSPQRQEDVVAELRSAGAARDGELVALAARLTSLMEEPVAAMANPVETLRRSSGLAYIDQLLQRHMHSALETRSHYPIDNYDLLSTRVARAGALPQPVRTALAGLQVQMRQVIHQIAMSIEESRYREVDVALDSIGGSFDDRRRATELVNADRAMHISYETLRLTVEFFSELNQGALARIQGEPSVRREANMVFGNALLILELTQFVISFIEEFRLTSDVRRLHSEALDKVRALREQQEQFRAWLRSTENIDPEVRANTLTESTNQEAALQTLVDEWTRYMSEVDALNSTIGDVRSLLPTLEAIHRSARLQIETLQQLSTLAVLRENSESIRGAVASLRGFRLAPLSPSRVRRLLGV